MPVNTFATGIDLSILIQDGLGNQVQLDGPREMFEENCDDKRIVGSPCDGGGKITQRVIPGGWSGSIESELATMSFKGSLGTLEALFYSGAPQAFYTINCTLRLPDGSTSRWMHNNVVFHGYKGGSHQREDMTKSRFEFGSQEVIIL